jgi:hypothetical protein
VTQRSTSKSPVQKNFFLPIEPVSVSPAPVKTPKIKVKNDLNRVKEKRLQDLDYELDQQELKFNDFESTHDLESLFFSYSSFLEGVIQCVASHVFKSYLARAKNGFIAVFRKVFGKLKGISVNHEEKTSQTLMTINPSKFSVILSKLGEIVNEEVAGTEKLEKFIQKNFIVNKRKAKVNNSGTQTEYKTGDNGVISYYFKTYDELEGELENMKSLNKELIKEKAFIEMKYEKLDDTEKLVYRNKILEDMVIKMRHSVVYRTEDNILEGELDEAYDCVFK